jgi:hypothetical protein
MHKFDHLERLIVVRFSVSIRHRKYEFIRKSESHSEHSSLAAASHRFFWEALMLS